MDPLGYIKIRSQRLLGMAINVFVKKDHILHVRDIEDQYVRFNVKEAVSLLTEIKEKLFKKMNTESECMIFYIFLGPKRWSQCEVQNLWRFPLLCKYAFMCA